MTLATSPAVLFPDAELVVSSYLRGIVDVPVLTVVPPERLDVPSERPDSFVLVQRTGGTRLNPLVDGAQMTVDSWAASDFAASALAQLVRCSLTSAPGEVVGDVPIYGVDEMGGPVNLPDPRSTQSRYTQTFRVSLRGTTPPAGS